MGFASLVADAMSMGLGDTLSEMAERDFIRREWERETWEMDTNPSGKVQEMQEFYVQKGVSEEDASRILEIFSKYKVFFVEHMMQVELGLLAPDEPPWAKGAVTFVSFCLFGAVPLASYAAVAATPGVTDGVLFGTCALFTAAATFLLGAVKGRVAQSSVAVSGALMTVNGGLAAAVSFLIGRAFEL